MFSHFYTVATTAIAGLMCLVMYGTAVRAEVVNPAPTVAELLIKTPQAAGVFSVTEKGEARHIQSGLVCPASFPNLNLWHLEIFSPWERLGTDVGCDYGRQGSNNRWTSKLTIYAVKVDQAITVDQAFARYQAEVKAQYPTAKVLGYAVTFEGETSPELKNVRSEEYMIMLEGLRLQSDLLVAVKNGWIIEIRATTVTDVSTVDEAGKAVGDMAVPAMAIMQALATVSETAN